MTTTGMHYTNTEDCNKTNTKLISQNLKSKIASVLSSLVSQIVVSIVVALFSLVIKIKPFKCLSGFCYPHKSKALKYETN
jgi:hypothetical protein